MSAPRLRLLSKRERRALPFRTRLAVIALDWHLNSRIRQPRYEPVEIDPETGHLTTFLTVSRMQLCLWQTRSPWHGEKFARECIRTLVALGLIEETDRVKLPKVPDDVRRRREGFYGWSPTHGGQSAQPSIFRSFFWPVFRLPTLPRIQSCVGTVYTTAGELRRSRISQACLSALLRCQALMKPWQPRSGFAPGSVQWAFQNSGPP